MSRSSYLIGFKKITLRDLKQRKFDELSETIIITAGRRVIVHFLHYLRTDTRTMMTHGPRVVSGHHGVMSGPMIVRWYATVVSDGRTLPSSLPVEKFVISEALVELREGVKARWTFKLVIGNCITTVTSKNSKEIVRISRLLLIYQ